MSVSFYKVTAVTRCMSEQVLGRETDYRVIINNGAGAETVIDIYFYRQLHCSYTFSSDITTTSYYVAVEVLGCGTQRVEAVNISTCE